MSTSAAETRANLQREALRRKLEVIEGRNGKLVHLVDSFMRTRTACGQTIPLSADSLTIRRRDFERLCKNCEHSLSFVLDCARLREVKRPKQRRVSP